MKATTAKRVTAVLVPFVLFLTLVAVSAVTLGGCSGGEESTTTSEETTTASEAVDTSTTETTEAETTTTTEAFPPTVTHQEDQSRFVYTGTWKDVSNSAASGRGFIYGNSSKCSLTVNFYGTGIAWVAKTSPAYGEASVVVDGGNPQTIDLYSAETKWRQKVWQDTELPLGDHTVTIAWTGKKNADAEETNINIDAVTVTGVLSATVEQDHSRFSYAGTWKNKKSSSSSGGDYFETDTDGSLMTLQFTGVQLVWLGRTGTGYGKAKVSIDGGPDSIVDLYSATTQSEQQIFDSGILPYEKHTVTIEWTGEKNADAKGTAIDIDAFVITGSL